MVKHSPLEFQDQAFGGTFSQKCFKTNRHVGNFPLKGIYVGLFACRKLLVPRAFSLRTLACKKGMDISVPNVIYKLLIGIIVPGRKH